MPFGLKNAPSVFERFMKHVFGRMISSGKLLTYLDDLLIATLSLEEHLEILQEVIDIIVRNGLHLRFDKCSFLQHEIVYLGYKITENSIRPNENNLNAIQSFPVPYNVKDVQSFLGLCSYFRKFIKNFAGIAKPLYDLIKGNKPFIFGPKEMETFEALKTKLVASPVLAIYSPNCATELQCDASSAGFGAVLMQKQSDGKFHPVFYFSKRATESESKYHSYELETLSIIYALRRFKIYLIGIPFKIITDCQALTLTLQKKSLNPRISRWALEMQSYDFVIEHRKGDRMMHVDALSRSFNILYVDDESFEFVLSAAQKQDPKIIAIASELEKAESSHFEMVDGLIYRKCKGKIRFYVPSHMEEQVIRTHHEAMCHLGVEKCFEHLSRTYWFPNMKTKIKCYVSKCLKCIYYSPQSGKTEGNLNPIPKGNVPFDVTHVDHLGPLPNTKSKKRHIFVIVDGFTKFTKLYPVKTTQSKEAIECLKSFFGNYSRPNKIVSDRGSCFTSKEFSSFLQDNDVIHVKVATHSPQSNGQVERVNRVLIPMLAKECEADTTSGWDKRLVKIEFALNNTVNRSTGFSPSVLLFGLNQKGELCDRVRDFLESSLENTRCNLEDLRAEASETLKKNQVNNKVYYDNRHKKPRTYQEGDYVMIKNVVTTPGINKKLLAKYRGPYKVKKVLSNDRYVIGDIEGLQLTRLPYKGISSPSNMRPYQVELPQLTGNDIEATEGCSKDLGSTD